MPVFLVCGSNLRGGLGLAASVGVEAALDGAPSVLLAELAPEPRRRPATLLAAPSARALESALRGRGLTASARGHLCHLALEDGPDALRELGAVAAGMEAGVVVAHVSASGWVPALDCAELEVRGGALLVELPAERSLAALGVDELGRRGLRAQIATRAPSALAARRALAGIRPGGSASAAGRRIARGLFGRASGREGESARARKRAAQGQSGQALPAVLAAALAVIGCALVLAAIGGAITGKGRVQRAADLSALSAARSMRDDLPRLLAPARLPDGSSNARHITKRQYLEAARAAARAAAERNGVAPARLEISFPDAEEDPPLRARVSVAAAIEPEELPPGAGPREAIPVSASAVAEASLPGSGWTGMPGQASGGGYSGPLVYRNGEGMRPDVAAAYDRMAAAARAAGYQLAVSSGFRSDAEQAELFAAHPDPRWVAPPGRSLHRCATELDLGPPSAYGWLAANAPRFGFIKRYSWEAWHFGYVAGPAPCSAAGESGGLRSGRPGSGGERRSGGLAPDGRASEEALPAFVPAQFREPLLRSASRWNVSAALLAAQLMAESGFNPRAVSPAGASGIAQFMPGTAASYGLRNPFDPIAAIDAQAHLMSDLLRQFRSVPLALAGYNAGPGAVAACSCVPPYPETRAYVARILALLRGSGALAVPQLEVRLVR